MVNLTVDAILMQMDHLALKPQELRGNGPGGWKGKAGMKKAQVVDACVSQLFAMNHFWGTYSETSLTRAC